MISPRRLLVLLYAASGAAALVYEVVWTRLLTLQLGHTVAAASTVLAAFMGGLALGAWIAGRTAAGSLRAYAALEILIAATALLLPIGLRAAVPALAWAYADGDAPTRFAIIRVVITLALLAVPTAAMGATFPIASQWLGEQERHLLSAGVLYAANTAGAAIGALAAGFWLIPAIGLRGATWVGVVLNVVAAAGALWIATKKATAEHAEHAEKTTSKTRRETLRAQRALRLPSSRSAPFAYAAVTVSGFAALVYEVAWTRLLALVIGPTTYAFATMAASFIAGLAIGSAVAARLARQTERPAAWLGALLIVGAAASVLTAWYAATRMPLTIAAQVADANVVFGRVVLTQALEVAVLLLPMTVALGAAFPLALAAASNPDSTVARATATVYAANTIGAILGALAGGFALIPWVGLRATFQIAALLSAIAGGICLTVSLREIGATKTRKHETGSSFVISWFRGVPFFLATGSTIAAATVVVLLPSWDHELLASGAYKYAPYLQSSELPAILRAGTLEYYKEGAAATVSVRQLTGVRSLAIDGKVDASNGGDMLTQRLLGLLPVLIHGSAEDVAVIGLGSGVTVGSALAAGTVRRADVVEISPEVVEASRFFDAESERPLSKPVVRLILGDGRSHLFLTSARYDVIVSEPSNPWMAGIASLFTREFFEGARARLKPDGVLCQWAHTYDISADDLKSIVRTFASVFPDGTMWLVGEGDLLLIGSNGRAIDDRLGDLEARCRRGFSAALLASLGVKPGSEPFSLLSLYAGGPSALARYGDAAVLQRDDRTALEYSAPRGIYGRTLADNARDIRTLAIDLPVAVRKAIDSATDADWTSRGVMLLKAEAFAFSYEAFLHAATMNSRNAEALAGLSDAAAAGRSEKQTLEWLTERARLEPANAVVRVELARVLASAGEYEKAIDVAGEALRITADDPRAAEQLASIYADAGDAERLAELAGRLRQRFPGRPDGEFYRATALFLAGRPEEAIAAITPVISAHPDHARAQNLLGAACATLGRRDCAESAFRASIRANPRDVSTYINLGTLQLQSANAEAAAGSFAEALALEPQSTAARNGLSQARAQSASANPQ